MKFEITKEWCARMAALEDDAEISAGLLAIDPVFDGEAIPNLEPDEPSIAFGRFVQLMRRSQRLSLEKLADNTDIDVAELVGIEDNSHFKPEVRTVYQLANFFDVPRAKLLQVAGLTTHNDSRLAEEAVRFAARSDSVATLTPEEKIALEAFITVLSEQK